MFLISFMKHHGVWHPYHAEAILMHVCVCVWVIISGWVLVRLSITILKVVSIERHIRQYSSQRNYR